MFFSAIRRKQCITGDLKTAITKRAIDTAISCTNTEKLYMNCLYALDGTYAFNGNTTAFIEMEDGINEYGLAAGLTFVYPVIKNAGLNSGILVRYILEKCKTTEEAIACIRALPIASQQTISVIDNTGAMAVIECNCRRIEIIRPTAGDNFIAATNGFHSEKMRAYKKHGIDDWRSEERYEVFNRIGGIDFKRTLRIYVSVRQENRCRYRLVGSIRRQT